MEFELEKLYAYVQENGQKYIDLLSRLCAQKSLANSHEGIDEMADLVEEVLKGHGLAVKRCKTPGNDCFIATAEGVSEKTIGYYHHYDVMPVEPLEEWESDPWTLTIRDGVMYARGAADNKGGLASSLSAIDAYQQVFGKLPCGVKFMLEGEEEIGSPNLPYFTEKYRDDLDCDGIIFEGGDRNGKGSPLEITSGVKGLLYLELSAHCAKSDAHSSLAAIVPNPAWRLVQALNTLKDENGKVLIDGFYDDITPLSESDLEALKHDGFNEEGTKEHMGIDAYINNMTGTDLLHALHYEPTCNIAGFVSGYIEEGSKTVLPAKALCKIDIRLVPDMDPAKITNLLKAHLEKHGFGDIHVEVLSGTPAYRSDADSDFAKVMESAAKRFTGLDPKVNHQAAGTMPLSFFCAEKNIPAGAVGCGSPNNNIHAPNELYRVEDYLDDICFRATLMHELGGRP